MTPPNITFNSTPVAEVLNRALQITFNIGAAPWTLGNEVNGFVRGKGQQWHREDFTKDMLPDGYRPLLLNELWAKGDEIMRAAVWAVADGSKGDAINTATVQKTWHCRTRRPLPPDADGWIPHTPGECPVEEAKRVRVKLRNGSSIKGLGSDFFWDERGSDTITHYKLADIPPADPYAELKAAHAAGKTTVQWRTKGSNGPWVDDTARYPAFDCPTFEFRAKPEPRYVPYDRDSIPMPLVVRSKSNSYRTIVLWVNDNSAFIAGAAAFTFDDLLANFTHDDGAPCGRRVE